MEYQLFTLPNGIRIIFKPAVSAVSHAGIMINAGARDEKPGCFGTAHFIEHLLFKRTERRNTSQILNRLEAIGADLNAYTTKEYTCIHASFLNPHLERTLDLFEDLVFHSTFPDQEVIKERSVILDEIASYLDSPEEAIADDFEDQLFTHHPLGHNILGTETDLLGTTRSDLLHFINTHYDTEGIVIGITGDYDTRKIMRIALKLFGNITPNSTHRKREAVAGYTPSHLSSEKPINQVHTVLGNQAYPIDHPHKSGLLLLNNLLGGMGMSSRLNMQIREKHGIAYTIESNYTPYSDTGIFSVYFGTDTEKAERATKLVYKELRKLREEKLGVLQLHQAKQKFIGQIALAEENRLGVILGMSKNLMEQGHIDSLQEVFSRIQAVTARQLQEIANEIFDEGSLSMLTFIPAGG